MTGNALIVGSDSGKDVILTFARFHYRGQRREDREQEYFGVYHPLDERMPRLRQAADGSVLHVADLYTDQELKASPVYNEWLRRAGAQNSLNVRMDGVEGSGIVWATADPVKTGSWSSAQTRMIHRLLPHLRQFVRVRQAMAGADALGDSLSGLLENNRVGIIHLDWRGRIAQVNDPALDILRRGDGLTAGADGILRAWLPADESRLARLLARVLPPAGRQGASGSMTVRRAYGLPSLVLHMAPVGGSQETFRPRNVSALLVLVDPLGRPRIDPRLVAETLGLTPTECEVAVSLAEGRTVRDVAAAGGRRENAVRFHLKRIYRRLGIAGQADLVRLVLSLTELPGARR